MDEPSPFRPERQGESHPREESRPQEDCLFQADRLQEAWPQGAGLKDAGPHDADWPQDDDLPRGDIPDGVPPEWVDMMWEERDKPADGEPAHEWEDILDWPPPPPRPAATMATILSVLRKPIHQLDAMEASLTLTLAARLESYVQARKIRLVHRLADTAIADQLRFARANASDTGGGSAEQAPAANPRTYRTLAGLGESVAVEEVACALAVTKRVAQRLVHEAGRLCGHYEPTLEALEKGDIAPAAATTIVLQGDTLPDQSIPGFQRELVPFATNRTVQSLAVKARRLRERLHPETITARRTKAFTDRRVTIGPEQDGMATMYSYLNAETIYGIERRITDAARLLQGPDESRTLTQLRADVWADLLTGEGVLPPGIAGEPLPPGPPPLPPAAPPTPYVAPPGGSGWRKDHGIRPAGKPVKTYHVRGGPGRPSRVGEPPPSALPSTFQPTRPPALHSSSPPGKTLEGPGNILEGSGNILPRNGHRFGQRHRYPHIWHRHIWASLNAAYLRAVRSYERACQEYDEEQAARSRAHLDAQSEARRVYLRSVGSQVAPPGLASGKAGGTACWSGIRPTVLVTVPVMTLLGGESPGSLDGYGPIPPDVARELAAAAPSFLRLLTHPETGAVLSVSKGQYRVPADMKRYVQARDRTCAFPGCRITADRCDLDHVDDFVRSQDTSVANLRPLCRRHHMYKHNTNWQPVGTTHQGPSHQRHPHGTDGLTQPADALAWRAPSGRIFTSHDELSHDEPPF